MTNISACLLGSANSKQQETISEIFEMKYSLVYLAPEFCTGATGTGKYDCKLLVHNFLLLYPKV